MKDVSITDINPFKYAEETQVFMDCLKTIVDNCCRAKTTFEDAESFKAWLEGSRKNVLENQADLNFKGQCQNPEASLNQMLLLDQCIKDKFLIDILRDSDGEPLMHVYTYFNEAFAITFLAPGGNLAGCSYWRNNGVIDENFRPKDVWLENDWRNHTMDVWGNAYSKAMNMDKK